MAVQKSQQEICQEFLKNPTINPSTGRTIQPGKGVYNDLVKMCGAPRGVAPSPGRVAPLPVIGSGFGSTSPQFGTTSVLPSIPTIGGGFHQTGLPQIGRLQQSGVMSAIPQVGGMPTFPQLGARAAIPQVGAVPQVGVVPQVGARAAIPQVGVVPQVGARAAIPQVGVMPTFPQIGAVTQVGVVPQVGARAAIPQVGSMGGIPNLPQVGNGKGLIEHQLSRTSSISSGEGLDILLIVSSPDNTKFYLIPETEEELISQAQSYASGGEDADSAEFVDFEEQIDEFVTDLVEGTLEDVNINKVLFIQIP
jgi:hypothetical protein